MPAPRLRPRLRRLLPLAAGILGAWAALGLQGCSDDEGNDGKALAGEKQGTERYVVYLKGDGPDLAAYRKARADGKDTREIEDALRTEARARVKPFRKELKAIDAKVVEVWYLTHAVTVEINSGNVATLKALDSVERVEPDVLHP